MPIEVFDLRAHRLVKMLSSITTAPDDKSVNQLKEEVLMSALTEVAQAAEEWALKKRVHAIGRTPDEAIYAFAEFGGWGKITEISILEDGDPMYTWGRRFFADGTSMKAAGWSVPGGVVLTWWK